jgi:hypothetical protein
MSDDHQVDSFLRFLIFYTAVLNRFFFFLLSFEQQKAIGRGCWEKKGYRPVNNPIRKRENVVYNTKRQATRFFRLKRLEFWLFSTVEIRWSERERKMSNTFEARWKLVDENRSLDTKSRITRIEVSLYQVTHTHTHSKLSVIFYTPQINTTIIKLLRVERYFFFFSSLISSFPFSGLSFFRISICFCRVSHSLSI